MKKIPSVQNMLSPSTGKPVANQFEIFTDDAKVFQSYSSIIAVKSIPGGKITLDVNYWDYSKTTSRYRNMFTGLSTAETKKAIEDGTIKLEDLNK